jgi:hypothetical protein
VVKKIRSEEGKGIEEICGVGKQEIEFSPEGQKC